MTASVPESPPETGALIDHFLTRRLMALGARPARVFDDPGALAAPENVGFFYRLKQG